MSKDTNELLGHADEADGIEEYDNPLPDWWVGLFWITIIWALGYTVHYHFIGNRSQVNDLAMEMAAAEARWPRPGSCPARYSLGATANSPSSTRNRCRCPCIARRISPA